MEKELIELIRNFIDEIKEPQEIILESLENEESEEIDLNILSQFFKDDQGQDDKYKFYELILMVSKISMNHYRPPNFYIIIEKILKNFENEIKQYYSNSDLFNLFKNDKRILLFLFMNKILIPDQSISQIIQNKKYKAKYYPEYFYPEFKSFFDSKFCNEIESKNPEIKEDIESFEEKRLIGENDSKICQFIRTDSLDEFIEFINSTNFPLNSNIKQSIYETNLFLLKKVNISLSEYAAFFGSIKILQYLYMKKIKLTDTLYYYSIHGNNPELFTFLEEKKIKTGISYENYLFESIKCHHIDIMNFLINEFNLQNDIINVTGIKYSNFVCMRTNDYINSVILTSIFCHSCAYGHCYIVNSFINNTDFNVNTKTVFFFLN